MRRLVAILLLIPFLFSCNTCKSPKFPKASSVRTTSTPSSGYMEASPSLSRLEPMITESPVTKPSKNGFDASTNISYYFSCYYISVPNYYTVRANTEDGLLLENAVVIPDALCFVTALSQSAFQEGFFNDMDAVNESFLPFFDESVVLSDESILVIDLPAVKVVGTGTKDGASIVYFGSYILDEARRSIIFFLCIQKEASVYDYFTDAEKMMQSIRFAPDNNRTETPAPRITDSPTLAPTATPTLEPTTTPKMVKEINYDSFMNIRMGMTMDEVQAILGDNPYLTSFSEAAGFKTEIYAWNGGGMSYVTVTLINGKVSGRGQVGLNARTKEVSASQFSQITKGMTYEQVATIMGGEGYITSESSLMGTTITMYQWDGNGLMSSAIITFQNGKVTSMSQYGLS